MAYAYEKVAPQTSGAEVPGSNPASEASPTMILMRCRIIVLLCKKLRVEGNLNPDAKKNL